MVAYIEGIIEFKGEKFLILKAGGIGYKIFVGVETMRKSPEREGAMKLWTHQYVREDALELYGFLRYAELEFFEMLIGISGIGPKGALGILSIAPLDTLKKAVASGDTSYLTRVSGIGRKTAEKIVLELKEKLAGKGVLVEAPELKDEADALDAMVALGYTQREAREALAAVSPETKSVEKRIREALKKLGERR